MAVLPGMESIGTLVNRFPELCGGCGLCEKACHKEAITMKIQTVKGMWRRLPEVNKDECINCGYCSAVCQSGAIRQGVDTLIKMMLRQKPEYMVFYCTWAGASGQELNLSKVPVPKNCQMVRVMCTGRIDPRQILDLFAQGIKGVLIFACPLEECEYKVGNYRLTHRVNLLQKMLTKAGFDAARLEAVFERLTDHVKVEAKVRDFVEKINAMGLQ